MLTYPNNTFTRTVNQLLFNGRPLAVAGDITLLSTLAYSWETNDPAVVRIDSVNGASATMTTLASGVADVTARVTTPGWASQIAPGKLTIIVGDVQFGIGFDPP